MSEESILGNFVKFIFAFFIEQFGFMGIGASIVVLILIMIIQAIIAPIASEAVLLASGLVLYEIYGLTGIYAAILGGVIGSLLGAWIAFRIARWVQSMFKKRLVDNYSDAKDIDINSRKERILHKLSIFLARFIDEESEDFIEIIEEKGFTIVLIGRLILIMPFDAISYGAGLSTIKFKDFMIATAIGTVPRVTAYVLLGAQLLDVLNTNPDLFIFIGMILALAIYGMYKYSMKLIRDQSSKKEVPEEVEKVLEESKS